MKRLTPRQAQAELAAREALQKQERQAAHMLACYYSFADFVKAFWHVVEPDTPIIWGWWLDQICEAVQKQVEDDPEYRWLLIIQPPGTAKSRILSVLAPAWMWLRKPSKRMFFVSTNDEAMTRDSAWTRDILKSDGWNEEADDPDLIQCGYRTVVRFLHEHGKQVPKSDPLHRYPLWDFEKHQDEKGNFANTRKGVRLCKPIGGGVTGLRGDHVAVDDPVSYDDIKDLPPATIALHMMQADKKARYIYSTRVNDREYSTRLMVMQRFDPDDPAGMALIDGHWKVICVSMEFFPDHPMRAHMGMDPRKKAGEPLIGYTIDPVTRRRVWRSLLTPAQKDALIRDLGIIQYNAQYNQMPKRATGEFVTSKDVENLDRYTESAQDIADRADEVMITADFTFDDTAGSDKVALHCWAREGMRFTLLDRVGKQMDYPTMKRELKWMRARWPMIRRIRIEKAAAGPMIRADLESEIPGMELVPTGWKSKWERAKVALQPLILGKNIVLPHASIAPWVAEVEASWIHMRPKGRDDDDVDAAALMGALWGVGGSEPLWLGPTIRAAMRPPLGTEPGFAGGAWQTWQHPIPRARYLIAVAGRTIVVLDSGGTVCCVATEPDATSMVETVNAILHRFGAEDVAVATEERTGDMWAQVLVAQLRAYRLLPRMSGWGVTPDAVEAVGIAMQVGRCKVADDAILRELASATKGEEGVSAPSGRWSERVVALTAAWAYGVRSGVFAKPGAPQKKSAPVGATESRIRARERAGFGTALTAEPSEMWSQR